MPKAQSMNRMNAFWAFCLCDRLKPWDTFNWGFCQSQCFKPLWNRRLNWISYVWLAQYFYEIALLYDCPVARLELSQRTSHPAHGVPLQAVAHRGLEAWFQAMQPPRGHMEDKWHFAGLLVLRGPFQHPNLIVSLRSNSLANYAERTSQSSTTGSERPLAPCSSCGMQVFLLKCIRDISVFLDISACVNDDWADSHITFQQI